jgi:hypothetical protein
MQGQIFLYVAVKASKMSRFFVNVAVNACQDLATLTTTSPPPPPPMSSCDSIQTCLGAGGEGGTDEIVQAFKVLAGDFSFPPSHSLHSSFSADLT